MEVLEGQNILVTISGKHDKIRVYYLSFLKTKILKSEGVSTLTVSQCRVSEGVSTLTVSECRVSEGVSTLTVILAVESGVGSQFVGYLKYNVSYERRKLSCVYCVWSVCFRRTRKPAAGRTSASWREPCISK